MRKLTDPLQNEQILDRASQYLAAPDDSAWERDLKANNGENLAERIEAAFIAKSRRELETVTTPTHISIVWAMYRETGRLRPNTEHEHGEDLVRMKVKQLTWLTAGLPHITWNIVACDDGCPDQPPSADVMAEIMLRENYPTTGPGSVQLLRLTELIGSTASLPCLQALTSTDESRKGGSILAGLAHALRTPPAGSDHCLVYTDADLSFNLGLLGSLVSRLNLPGRTSTNQVHAVIGQRYAHPDAVIVNADRVTREPETTGAKPTKIVLLLRHFLRVVLMPELNELPDVHGGFKAFTAISLQTILSRMKAVNSTFDVELLLNIAREYEPGAIISVPIMMVEDLAASNFPATTVSSHHLEMFHQIIHTFEKTRKQDVPLTDEQTQALQFFSNLNFPTFDRLLEKLNVADIGDETLFERRWNIDHLAALAGLP